MQQSRDIERERLVLDDDRLDGGRLHQDHLEEEPQHVVREVAVVQLDRLHECIVP